MYTLYFSPGAASLAVHWMLIELGVTHELVRMNINAGDQKQSDYLKLNPTGVVPTLIVDGAPVYETAALLMLLAERHPQAALAPAIGTPERAAYLQWMFHFSNTVQTTFHGWFHPERAAGGDAQPQIKEAARVALEAGWDRVDQHLQSTGPYMNGAKLSALDFLATTTMRWSRNMPRPATSWPAIADYAVRMKARPTFAKLYAAEGLTDWA